MTSTITARRRAHALRATDATPAPGRLEAWIESLCLPVDGPRLARVLRPLALGTAVSAALVGGLLLVTLTVLAGGWALWLRRGAVRRRAAAVDRDLPGLVEAVARHLRAGGSLGQAIVAAAPNASGPLETPWDRMVRDIPVVGVVAALEAWISGGERLVQPSERLAAAALALAAESGGSPARAVDGVAATLRARLALAGEIRALSSQARASACVIALIPFGFGLFAAATDARTAAFFGSPAGLVLLAAGVGLDGIGAWWMACLCRSPIRGAAPSRAWGASFRMFDRRRRARARAEIDAGIPDLVDLFAVAIGSGMNVRLAVAAVALRSPPGPLAEELARAGATAAAGARLADSLEQLPARLSTESVRPLVAVLVDAERYGTALGPSLERLADEARRSRHHRAEEAARRVPVKLLFPLVMCVLPAFGLLTVAPLIAGGLRALRL